jgi:hypothetical protein
VIQAGIRQEKPRDKSEGREEKRLVPLIIGIERIQDGDIG